jgi:ATP-binding cassette subfamily C protein
LGQSLHVSSIHTVRHLINDFGLAYPRKTLALTIALLVAGLLEGISVMALLTVFIGTGTQSAESTAIHAMTERILGGFGLDVTFNSILLLVVLLMLLKGAIAWWATKQVADAVTGVTAQLRSRLVWAVLRAQWSYFTSRPVGVFANALSGEADRTGQAYEAFCQVFANTVQLAVYVAVAFALSWQVTAAAIVLGGILTLALRQLARQDRRVGRDQTRLFKLLSVRVADGLKGIKPLKAMARENELGTFLQDKVFQLNDALKRSIIYKRAVGNIGEPLIAVALAIVIYAGNEFFQLTPVALLVMAAIFFRILTRIGQIQQAWQVVLHEESAYRSLKQIIDEAEHEREERPAGIVPALPSTIELSDVGFHYGATRVLQDVTLRITPGTITTIAGPSGSGKTTLTELIIGLRKPSSGCIAVGGIPLDEIDVEKWRSAIGYVPQEFSLFNDTVLANLTLGDPAVSERDVVKALQQADAWTFVQKLRLQLHTPVGESGLELSGGQRQRIALARALLRKPALLILDEATSSLDAETEAAICRTIQSLKSGLAVLVVTHQPAWLDVSDVVYRLPRTESA